MKMSNDLYTCDHCDNKHSNEFSTLCSQCCRELESGPVVYTERKEPYCDHCDLGADYILSEATLQWDVDAQEWKIVSEDDGHFHCSYCDVWRQSYLKWRPLDENNNPR